MKGRFATARPPAGAASPMLIGLTTLGGFAAGALTMGLVAFSGRAASSADVSHVPAAIVPAQSVTHAAAMREVIPILTRDPGQPDRPADPDGWSYDPAGQVDCSLAFSDPACRASAQTKK